MKHRHFLRAIEHDRVVAAIAEAEKKTSGEIRVYISRRKPPDSAAALALARSRFTQLKMHETKHRNGVLLLLAPDARKFAVVGDTGVDAKCGADFWQGIAGEMAARLRASDYTGAIVWAVGEVGRILAAHFPAEAGAAGNELSNEIVED